MYGISGSSSVYLTPIIHGVYRSVDRHSLGSTVCFSAEKQHFCAQTLDDSRFMSRLTTHEYLQRIFNGRMHATTANIHVNVNNAITLHCLPGVWQGNSPLSTRSQSLYLKSALAVCNVARYSRSNPFLPCRENKKPSIIKSWSGKISYGLSTVRQQKLNRLNYLFLATAILGNGRECVTFVRLLFFRFALSRGHGSRVLSSPCWRIIDITRVKSSGR